MRIRDAATRHDRRPHDDVSLPAHPWSSGHISDAMDIPVTDTGLLIIDETTLNKPHA
jgi:hypothetical protein